MTVMIIIVTFIISAIMSGYDIPGARLYIHINSF